MTADQQTAGKGANKSSWVSVSGNVHFTIALQEKVIPEKRKFLLPLEIGVAVFQYYHTYIYIIL